MIELTTGVVFLMSSLYGSGQAAQVAAVTNPNATSTVTQSTSTTTPTGQITDSNTSVMQAYLRKQFGDDSILVDIARCESNYHQFDVNGNIIRNTKTGDIGVMQINEKFHAATAKKLGFDLNTVEGNVGYAKHLYDEQGVQPWMSSSKCWGGDLAKQ